MSITDGSRILATIRVAMFALGFVGQVAILGADGNSNLTAEERQRIEGRMRELKGRIEALRKKVSRPSEDLGDRLADVEVFVKGITWALKYDTTFSQVDRGLLNSSLERCQGRIDALEVGDSPWTQRKGKVVRGYVSAVDGSVQPYAVIVPANYDRNQPSRLDVVLHGSTQAVGMSELRFLVRFDEGGAQSETAPDSDYIELHPLGRVENGYRWAGETDVFEAIEAVCRNYNIDRDRIVLRGMSMGASGTWHLGLKHPDRFVALGPYCGYVDTHEFSKTPLPNFVVVGTLPPYQEKTLHMLDSVDYAANAGVVPCVACMGEKDVFFQAHEIMKRAMAKEGLMMVNLISPGTGHVIDPVTHKEQMRRLGEFASKGLNHAPRHLRFVTWTLKYSRCHWLQVLGMGRHYDRAEIEGTIHEDGSVELSEPKNVTRFAILAPIAATLNTVRIGDATVTIPPRGEGGNRPGIILGRQEGHWVYLGELDRVTLEGKRPGMQGPIDDAFTAPFLCVRGTGTAQDPAVQAWAEASLLRFSDEWSRYFRGELPIKDDTAVTEEDARRFNLILFGDPGSNSWIARVLPRLPVHWTRQDCEIGDVKVPATGHAPIFIQPNPFAPSRYVVVNSGHTFHKMELSTLNYLLFPRLGDWAVVRIPDRAPDDRSQSPNEEVIRTGFFDEEWRPPVSRKDRAGFEPSPPIATSPVSLKTNR